LYTLTSIRVFSNTFCNIGAATLAREHLRGNIGAGTLVREHWRGNIGAGTFCNIFQQWRRKELKNTV